ncbi:NAD(P)-binding protein [Paenibacillus puerhi]|uniref:NAD(P)-binding protein n=1 Tax=Paenibacillus puerhi TaxID=2692622 RepID=UPI00135BBEDE|nr:NAD(P)-binding protein [Paenibacillus puerhi]
MKSIEKTYDVAVIGGGLSGLTASIYLAKAGLYPFFIVEKMNQLGGRAMTVKKKGASLNMGVHAFYLDGEGEAG